MLARKVITRRGRRFRGYFPSSKLGRMVAWESLLERDAILLIEFSPGVLSYQEQPALVQYADGTRVRDYYPDFELELANGKRIHVEVKSSHQLAKPEFKAKYTAIAEHYARIRMDYRIVTEAEICREPLQTNLRLLAYLVGRKGLRLPGARELSEEFGSDAVPFEVLETVLGRATTLRLLASGRLECDLDLPLTGDTPVSVTKGERNAAIFL
ncbi:MAG: TnsA endonuclease N-terminal domain-containing protein [Thiobacillus sp.]